MKNLVPILLLLMLSFIANAQSSKGFSFQGYARGADGSALQNEPAISVRFTIYTTDENSPQFSEVQDISTDEFGVFQTIIGTVSTSSFNALNFALNNYTLKVELLDGGSWQEVTKKSLLAVPYAKAAEKATIAESVQSGSNGVPVGSIMPFAGPSTKVPAGWILCDGREIDRTTYAALFSVIGDAWGEGNNSTTFQVPDLRGVFVRGVNGGATGTYSDPNSTARDAKYNGGNAGNDVGSYQADEMQSHNHGVSTNNDTHYHKYDEYYWSDTGNDAAYSTASGDDVGQRIYSLRSTQSDTHNHSVNQNNVGGSETRPANAYVNYIIKN